MEEVKTDSGVKKFPHHDRVGICTTRPPYRQGKKLTAVKVYTVNEESQHLLIRGVPALNLQKELKHLCMRFGEIKFVNFVRNYSEEEEPFTEVYHVLYVRIQAARFAKHMIDDKNFFGSILHACYAPELESLTETKNKLVQRKRDVLRRIKSSDRPNHGKSVTSEGTFPEEFASQSANLVPSVPEFTHCGTDPQQSNQQVPIGPSVPSTQHPISIRGVVKATSATMDNPVPPVCRRPAPDKFIPSSIKRIRFNKS